jgi:hypothetical protein
MISLFYARQLTWICQGLMYNIQYKFAGFMR